MDLLCEIKILIAGGRVVINEGTCRIMDQVRDLNVVTRMLIP